MIGPGKYDEVATVARKLSGARGVIVVVFEGEEGNGFSAQLPSDLVDKVPSALRQMADQIEADKAQQSLNAAVRPNPGQ